MKASDILASALVSRHKTQKELAAGLGILESTLSKQIRQNIIPAQELVDAAEWLGYAVTLVDKETEDDMPILQKGIGPRLRKQINGVVYDTDKSSAICHTEPVDGWWKELYRTKDGTLFVAHYTEWDGVDGFITLCPESAATALIEQNGG